MKNGKGDLEDRLELVRLNEEVRERLLGANVAHLDQIVSQIALHANISDGDLTRCTDKVRMGQRAPVIPRKTGALLAKASSKMKSKE